MHNAVNFNNVGVDFYLKRDYESAWDLFKGALEVMLVVEHHIHVNDGEIASSTLESSTNISCLMGKNSFVRKAESIILKVGVERVSMTNFTLNEADSETHELGQGEEQFSTDSPRSSLALENVTSPFTASLNMDREEYGTDGPLVSLQVTAKHENSDRFQPYIHCCPFSVSIDDTSQGEQASTTSTSCLKNQSQHLKSAIVIFNLALVEHTVDRSSGTAISLYELAASLLVNRETSTLFGVALVNNIGIWYYENDVIESSQRCMKYLSN